jgi:uncharacterized BrkB/YihY/UPF0761 family membrane protein
MRRRWRELLIASHRRYTGANGDALAGAVTYAVLLALIPALLVAGRATAWIAPDAAGAAVRRAADRTLPTDVAKLVAGATVDLDRGLGVVAIAIVAWVSVRAIRALRTAVRAMCGQPSGSGNPIADTLRDVVLAVGAAVLVGAAVSLVAASASRVAAQMIAVPLLAAVCVAAVWFLPWPDDDRPTPVRAVGAGVAAAVGISLVVTIGGVYLEATLPGRGVVFGGAAVLVTSAVVVALSARALLRAVSVAAVLQMWARPAPPDPRQLAVIIPAYQEAVGIRATLDALARQTDTDFTLVVGDNGSTDGTVEVVERFAATAPFPVEVVVDDERGVGCAVDAAARRAIGLGAELLARTDADALPRPDWVAAIRDRFARGAEVVCGASIPRRDERPNPFERWILPTVQRLLAVYGRYRGPHRGEEYLAPYVLTHGHSFAITAAVYRAAGGAVRQELQLGSEDVDLLNRARRVTAHVVRADEVVVENSLRRLRRWGVRRTLLWYWDRRWTPATADEVHVRGVR